MFLTAHIRTISRNCPNHVRDLIVEPNRSQRKKYQFYDRTLMICLIINASIMSSVK